MQEAFFALLIIAETSAKGKKS